jgi:hypothetical protein
MVTQYEPSLPPAMYVFILNKVFQFHQMDSFKQTQLGLPSVHSSCGLWSQLAICALNTHLSGYSKTTEAGIILEIFFVSLACIFYF